MIVLINTPLKLNEYSFTSIQYPVNLGYLASVLLKEKFPVEIWDYSVERFTEEKFINRIKKTNPDIVGFSAITPNIKNADKMANIVKKISKKIITVVGGPHLTSLPFRTLEEFPNFDVGVVGEGEETLLELVKGISLKKEWKKIKGIVYRDNGEILQTERRPVIENIDSIPFPERGLLDIDLYKHSHPTKIIRRKEKRIIEIITSRGCPFNCFFCAGHDVFQYNTRFRSTGNVLQEIDMCIEKYRINHLTILDNTFTLDEKRVIILSEEFKKRNLTFDCNSRVDTVSESLLEKMARCGCIKISFGIESGSERILKLINKKTNINQIKKTINYARKTGIQILEGTAIIGSHPSETEEEVKETIAFLKKLELDYVVVDIIVPYPGSPVYQYMKERNLILSEDWDRYVPYGKTPCWKTENFQPEELQKMQKKAMFSFYFRPKYIYKKIKSIKNLDELFYFLRILFDFLFKRGR